MSDSNKEKKDEFFYIETDDLRVDEPIGFDCFIHLEENNKVIHWMREGAVLTQTRKDKLRRFGFPPVMVLTSQRVKYMNYVAVAGKATATTHGKVVVGQEQTERVFGRMRPVESVSVQPRNKPFSTQGKVSAEFLNTVIKTTLDVFSENFFAPLKFKPAVPRKENASAGFEVDVASFIGLTSDSLRGTIGLCFPTETYRYLLWQATGGTAYETVTPELYLGAGEFMFVIYETARPRLMEIGYMIDRAIPTLTVGKNMPIPALIPDKGFSIAFECDGGPFSFEIGIKTGT